MAFVEVQVLSPIQCLLLVIGGHPSRPDALALCNSVAFKLGRATDDCPKVCVPRPHACRTMPRYVTHVSSLQAATAPRSPPPAIAVALGQGVCESSTNR